MPFCPFYNLQCPETNEGDAGCVLYNGGCCNFYFGGNVYSKTMTMENDNATRFETTTKKLRDVIIQVGLNAMLLGATGAEVYTVGVRETVGFTQVDISTLYFKNLVAGSNGKITIIGVEE